MSGISLNKRGNALSRIKHQLLGASKCSDASTAQLPLRSYRNFWFCARFPLSLSDIHQQAPLVYIMRKKSPMGAQKVINAIPDDLRWERENFYSELAHVKWINR
jgi:hypothetical protein